MAESNKIVKGNSIEYGALEGGKQNTDDVEKTNESLYGRLFPRGLKTDTKAIMHLTWPMTMCQLMIFLLGPISLVFAGHIGDLELAAVALAVSLVNVTGLSIMIGLATVCDTLMSNAYGSVNKKLVGIYGQRAFCIMPLFCFPCWAVHLNSKKLLILLGQDPYVSELAEQFLLVFSPGLLFCCLHQILLKYLVTQNIVVPNVLMGILGNAGSIGLQYLFVDKLNWGIAGCAAGMVFGFVIFFTSTLLFILIFKVHKETWGGWSWKALEDWGLFVKLAIAGLIMIAMEWWTFEFGIFMSGMLSRVYLSANSLVFNMENLFYTLPMSFGVAASVRVGQKLGSGDAVGAKNAARVAQFLALIGFVIEALIILASRNYLPYIFTNDTVVAELVSAILIWLMIELGLDAITAVSMGIMRGAGRQRLGAIGSVFGFFLIALPLAGVFMFVFDYGALGFWYGLIIGITPICIVYIVLQTRIDWDSEVVKALKRVEVDEVSSSVLADVKRGDSVSKTKIDGKLLCKRFLVFFGFTSILGVGLIARYATPNTSAFAPRNYTDVSNATSYLTSSQISVGY